MPAESAPTSPRYGLVVLSMHRSGSSALTGLFGKMGCDLPVRLMPGNKNNPRGHFESNEIYKINDALLASGESSWDDWQEFDPDWITSPEADTFLTRGKEVLDEEFGASRLFVIKDPRICRLLPYWRKLLDARDITPVYVHNHRHPLEVARSLQTREKWPFGYGLLLWLRHVLDAEFQTRGCTRVFTNFERTLENWRDIVSTVQTHSDIVFPHEPAQAAPDIDSFLSKDLRHNIEPKTSNDLTPLLSEWITWTYDILERWVAAGEDAKDHKTLDKVRERYTASTPMFGSLIETMRATLKETAQEARDAAEHRDQLSADIERLATEHATLEAKHDSLKAEHDNLQTERNHLKVEREGLRAERNRLQAERDSLRMAARQAHDAHMRKQASQRAYIASLKSEKAMILSSTSWKLTAPIRRIINVLRS